MKKSWLLIVAAFIFSFIILTCASTSPSTISNLPDELDMILREVSDYLNESIPKGRKIAIINIQSGSTALTDYIIDVLIANAVNDRNFSVVDRQQLDTIRAELNFNLSGEVSDQSAQSVGKMLGAQTIITGRVSQIGERYRLNIRALEVETVQVQGSNNWNIAAGATITALMRSGGGSGVGTQTTTTITTENSSNTQASTSVTEEIPEGAIIVNSAATWNSAINRIRNGGNDQTYIINVSGNFSVPAPPYDESTFGSVTGITVTIQGNGTLSLSVNGNLLNIGARQTVIIRDVTLRGRSDNNVRLVVIKNLGVFRMEGRSSIVGNTSYTGGGVEVRNGSNFIMQDNASITGNSNFSGGGVEVWSGGTFTMQGGSINGNQALNHGNSSGTGAGGGVHVRGGTFIMENDSITGNTANGYHQGGGGVFVENGTFSMQGGLIAGNTDTGSRGGGGGVYVSNRGNDRGTFTKIGGTIYGNDVSLGDRNSSSWQGHAVYFGSNPDRWRNATAGPDDVTDGYGFFLND